MHLGTKTEVQYAKYLNKRINSVRTTQRRIKDIHIKLINDGKLEALREAKAELIKMIKERKQYYHVDK